jgi:pimeloyl-ACP methyl ester carboxylesterase
VSRLVILSVPHPRGFLREMETNSAQRANSQYARDNMAEGAEAKLTPEALAAWVQDPQIKAQYIEAFERSDFKAMLNYYRANYPGAAGGFADALQPADMPNIRCPVLVIHGLEDKALLAAGHSGTWDWVDGDTTLLMIPGAGHFVHHDASALVGGTITSWLTLRAERHA